MRYRLNAAGDGYKMTDGRNRDAAKKGWQTRHARQRTLKDAQDYAKASTNQSNIVTLQEAERVYQQNEEPEARKDRLAKLKAWWRWFYHGE